MGFKLPTEGCFPQKFGLPDDLTAEQYYEKLLKMDVRYVYVDACGEAGEEGHKFPDKTVIVEGCGSCSGRKRRGEPEDGDADDRSEREIARTRVTIAKAIRNHKGRGTIPGDLVRWSDEALRPPKIRWQDKLARACRGAVAYRPGSGYSTYAKLSRRQAGIGFGSGKPTLPSYRATLPRVTFLVDTSGSMDNDALIRAMSEAQGILTTCGAQLDVVVCDAEVHGAKSVRSIKEACALLKGGGGSDFRPAFDQILRARPKPSIIVAATDGDIAVPVNEPPGVRVIWLLVAKGYDGRSRTPCDWGTVIEIDS
jgi:predicted metal-dependent peptidase